MECFTHLRVLTTHAKACRNRDKACPKEPPATYTWPLAGLCRQLMSSQMNVDELFRNRNRLFWILNVSGWAGYLFAGWLGALAHEKSESYFDLLSAVAVIGFIASIGMRYLYRAL